MNLLCLGDVAIAENTLKEYLWIPPKELLPDEETKILFNWELPIGEVMNTKPRDCGGKRLLSLPSSIQAIKNWAPGFTALATNHILDSGEDGLEQTITSLKKQGFITFGAGLTKEEISRPLIWETKEGKLAIINWVFPETHPDWMHIPGPNCWPGIDEANRYVQKIKQKVDWVMVFAHWSDELFPYPRPEDRVFANKIAELGIDILICHHPHVVRGMEMIGSCPVFYSIGNFYFSEYKDSSGEWIVKLAPRNHEGLGVFVSFKKGKKVEFSLISFWQERNKVVIDKFFRAYRRMEKVTPPLSKLNWSEYRNWYKTRRNLFNKVEFKWCFGILRLGLKGTFLKILKILKNLKRNIYLIDS